jgi:hypothetical protein
MDETLNLPIGKAPLQVQHSAKKIHVQAKHMSTKDSAPIRVWVYPLSYPSSTAIYLPTLSVTNILAEKPCQDQYE